MSEQSRWEYYITMHLRYLKAEKAEKAEKQKILDEFCKVCRYHRKYAIKKLNQSPDIDKMKRRSRCGRKSKYKTEGILEFIRRLWISTNQICSKRMVAIIPLWLSKYKPEQSILAESDKEKLLRISSIAIISLYLKVPQKCLNVS